MEDWGLANDINMALTWDTDSGEPPQVTLAEVYYQNPLATEEELMMLA